MSNFSKMKAKLIAAVKRSGVTAKVTTKLVLKALATHKKWGNQSVQLIAWTNAVLNYSSIHEELYTCVESVTLDHYERLSSDEYTSFICDLN